MTLQWPSTEVSLVELSVFCEKLIKTFSKKQLVLLEGELGVGKTTVVQNIARHFGFATADSPTFSIINEYPTLPKIFHVDLYRLESAHDVESTGFWDLFSQESGFIFVEWPSRVPEKEWPKSWSPLRVTLATTDLADYRRITVTSL